ncbi:MAG: hypothetical protein H0Z19_08485 [Archaeoglobus sp.]|uniref:hypothetical protein n=1 Tax=Archaeoglobus sp. TaxID=1872626 RepID=UPI001D8B6E15|nr:hypothetical protein [Archaeoglobus sp.]MBO8180497.1 hypothetical protein [Archaeoglobus sp.]
MSQKVKIYIYVDSDIWDAFKNYVFSKYGTLHKYLGDEISRALDSYLKDAQPTHIQEFEHMISKPNKKHLKLLVWLLKNYPKEVLYSEIKLFINDYYGIDKRTVKKYLHDFLIQGNFVKTLKPIKANSDWILKVNTDRILNYLGKFISEEELREKYGIYKETFAHEEETKEKEKKSELKEYVAERLEAGDSLDEIKEKVEDFGVELSKKVVRSIARKAMRDKHA